MLRSSKLFFNSEPREKVRYTPIPVAAWSKALMCWTARTLGSWVRIQNRKRPEELLCEICFYMQFSLMYATCPANLVLLNVMTLIIFGEENKL
jgi:hypothetical protein